MEEIWRPVVGYEGLYEVSNMGRVRSLNREVNNRNNTTRVIEGKIIRQIKRRKGYVSVNLNKNGSHQAKLVHRLVAETFVPNPENKPFVDHIVPVLSGGTNHADNLRWVTHLENMNNPLTLEKLRKLDPLRVAKKVKMIKDGVCLREFNSVTQAAEFIGGKTGNISHCLRKDYCYKTAYGYQWEYAK